MDKEALVIECRRTDYSMGDVIIGRKTMTVGELREILDSYDDETPIVTSHDNGYTYGPLQGALFRTEYAECPE